MYGGNGPLHAGKQAEELGIRKIIVPRTSPAFSALGLLVANYVVENQRAYITPSKQAKVEEINAALVELSDGAARDLASAGIERSQIAFERYLCLSYPGQTFDIPVPFSGSIEQTVSAFHDMHEKTHTYAVRDEQPVIRSVRLKAIGQSKKPHLPIGEPSRGGVDAAKTGKRRAYFDGKFVDTAVFAGDRLGVGHKLEGPAIIEERFTTIVLYPGHRAELDMHGNYIITLPS